jgi:hypothetical protein
MLLPRIASLVLFSSLLSLSAATSPAQTSKQKNDVSDQPQLNGLAVSPDFRAHIVASSRPLHLLRKSEEENDVCYYIRSYRVTRDDPGSDETRAAGYTICQLGGRFQTKTAVDTREIGPSLIR